MRSDSSPPVLFLLGAALLSLGASAGSARLIAPVRGRVSSGFGERLNPVTKRKEFHNGIDIEIRDGSNVAAADSGKISNVYTSDVGGLQIVLRHDSGMTSGYAHLSKSLVKVGDHVDRGDVIALSGHSGQVTGSHLHFSLRDKKGKYLNPEKRISL